MRQLFQLAFNQGSHDGHGLKLADQMVSQGGRQSAHQGIAGRFLPQI
jgi:hypothetical protein